MSSSSESLDTLAEEKLFNLIRTAVRSAAEMSNQSFNGIDSQPQQASTKAGDFHTDNPEKIRRRIEKIKLIDGQR